MSGKSTVNFVTGTSPNGSFKASVIFTELEGIDDEVLTSYEKAILSLVMNERLKTSERLRLLTQFVQSLEDKGEIK